MWISVSTANGGTFKNRFPNFLKNLNITTAQIAEAEKLARECVRMKFKGC
jgi:hypothetical protein